MKKLSKILMILFVLALAVSAFAFSAFAEEGEIVVAAEVYSDAACQTLVNSYASVEEALTAAEAGQYVIIKTNAENFEPKGKVADGVYVKAAEDCAFSVTDNTYLSLNAADENGFQSTWSAEFKVIAADGTVTKYDGSVFEAQVIASGANSSSRTVVLLADIYSAKSTTADKMSYGTSAPKNLYIDLNGHSLVYESGTRIFRMNRSSATINIYSSVKGGYIYSNACRLIDFNDSADYNNTLNLGKVTDANGTTHDGDNLTILAGYLLYTSINTAAKNTLNIDGGHYYTRSTAFYSRGDNVVNVNNATVIANKKTFETTAAGILNLTCTNSNLICQDGVMTALLASGTVTFENSNINGTISGCTGSIVLKSGVNISTTTDINSDFITIEAGNTLFDSTEISDVEYRYCAITAATGLIAKSNQEEAVDYTYFILPESAIPSLSGVKMNVSTFNGFWMNFYIPAESGIKLAKPAVANGTVTVGSVEYNVFTVKGISPAKVDDADVNVTFAHNGRSFTYGIKLSLLDYFTAALANAAAGSVDKALIINAVNYCNEVYEHATGAECPEYTAIVAQAEEGMIVTGGGNEVSNLYDTEYATILNGQLIVGDGNVPMFAFGAVNSEVAVYATYTDISGKQITVKCAVQTISDKAYYVVEEMKAYDFTATVTVSLDEAGEEKLLEYNLAAYMASEGGKTVSVDDALYSFAVAAYNFKTVK